MWYPLGIVLAGTITVGSARKRFTQLEFKNEAERSVAVYKDDETGYIMVDLQSQDRLALLFDTVCTITDCGYGARIEVWKRAIEACTAFAVPALEN